MDELGEALSKPFEITHRRPIGGGEDAEYLTGEQVVTRLNEVLTPLGWSFVVKERGLSVQADEAWCVGQLVVERWPDGEGGFQPCHVTKEQFGSQKIKRARSSDGTGVPLDIGFDMKGAATDALKKCATLLGVGLYLSEKEAKGAPRS